MSDLEIKYIANSIYNNCLENKISISKQIVKDDVTLENIDSVLEEFVKKSNNSSNENVKELLDILKEIQSPIYINLYIDKEPYIKKLSDDKVINVTGQTGSGKSTYVKEHFTSDEYLLVDTDEILSDNRFKNTSGINKELGEYFRNKYDVLPDCFNNFDLIYKEILDYCKKYDKTIVIDCAQFHCIKDISLLKGTIIIIRTCISNCYSRAIERFKNTSTYTDEELQEYIERKKAVFKWYKGSNEFIKKINEL